MCVFMSWSFDFDKLCSALLRSVHVFSDLLFGSGCVGRIALLWQLAVLLAAAAQ
jgi:hypothetical protein